MNIPTLDYLAVKAWQRPIIHVWLTAPYPNRFCSGFNWGYTLSRYHWKGRHLSLSLSFFLSDTFPMSIPWLWRKKITLSLFLFFQLRISAIFHENIFRSNSCYKSYPYGEVPCDFHVVFVVIHPHLCHAQCITSHSGCQVRRVRLFQSFNVSYFRARYHLYAASTQPHLKTQQVLGRTKGACFSPALHKQTYWSLKSHISNYFKDHGIVG